MADTMNDLVSQVQENAKNITNMAMMAGPSLMTHPELVDSGRMNMFNTHFTLQHVVLNHTESPKVFTNFENIVGEESSYNIEAESDLDVIKIIPKYPDIETGKDIQTVLVFVYNHEKEMYDVIVRKDVEEMPEKYGFPYDNSGINKFKEGDTIPKGTPLIHPTSYDEYGNYGFGVNVRAMWLSDDDTIEDNITVSETLNKMMESTEEEEVVVPLNHNDILVNWYGDDEHYQGFPNIGEKTNKMILSLVRRLNKGRVLYDLKNSNMRRHLSTDRPYFGDGTVVDIDIYHGIPLEEINRTEFNAQLLHYMEMLDRFYETIRDFTRELLDSGVKCSQEIRSWNKRSTEIADQTYVKRDETNSDTGYIRIYFTIKRTVGIVRGQKGTGRHGNKGVCGNVVPDKLMPHLDNGEIVHIVLSTLGTFNRLIIFPIYEQYINFIGNRTVEYFKANNCSLEERARITFRFLEIISPHERDRFKELYDNMTLKEKQEFFDVIDKHGIRVDIKPFWHEVNLFDAIEQIDKEFPWVVPYSVYFFEQNSSRWVKMMKPQIVAEIYFMKLKQSSKKQLSACSYAPLGRTGVPEKTDSAKKHKILVPPTPIKKGIQESINTMISVTPNTYAKQHMFYRSSPIAGRALGSAILDNYGLNRPVEPELTEKMSARNVEKLNAYNLIMGTELEFDQDELYLPQLFEEDYDKDQKFEHRMDGETYYATPEYMLRQYAKKRVREKTENNEIGYIYIGEEGEYKDEVIEEWTDILESQILDDGVEFFYNEDLLED